MSGGGSASAAPNPFDVAQQTLSASAPKANPFDVAMANMGRAPTAPPQMQPSMEDAYQSPEWKQVNNPGTEFLQALTAPGTGVMSRTGQFLDKTGKLIWAGGEDAMNQIVNAGHGQQDPENSAAVLNNEQPPAEAAMSDLPASQRILASGVKGLVQSAPQMALAAADPALGALAFGATPTGFDPKQAAMAAVLPFVGKYAGAITEAMATKAGVTSDLAQSAFNKMGGASGAAALIGADQLNQIAQLPPDQRKGALIDAAGNVGSMFLLGTMGERQAVERPANVGEETVSGSNDAPPPNPFDVAQSRMDAVNKNAGSPNLVKTDALNQNVGNAGNVNQVETPPPHPAVAVVDDLAAKLQELRDSLTNPFKAGAEAEDTPPPPPPGAGSSTETSGINGSPDEAINTASEPADPETTPSAPPDSGSAGLKSGDKVIYQGKIETVQAVYPYGSGLVQLGDHFWANVRDLKPADSDATPASEPADEPASTEQPSPPEAATAPAAPAASVARSGDEEGNVLTPGPDDAIKGEAAPVTSTVRSAEEETSGNERQRGRVPGNPGMTAEEGLNPSLGAAEISPTSPATTGRKKVSRADMDRPHDLIDQVEGEVGYIDPTLIKEANPDWKPVGAARKLFKKGGVPADVAADAMHRDGMYKGDPGQVDQFGDALNAAGQARKGWRRQFFGQERQTNEEAKRTQNFQKDVAQKTKTTEPLVPDDLNEGDKFQLKGANFKVTRLDYDEDGRVTGLTLDDGKKYGTQEVDGQTTLRMDKGSLEKAAGEDHPEAPLPDSFKAKAEKLASKLEAIKSGVKFGGPQTHAFGIAADLWDRAVSVAQGIIRGGGTLGDAIEAAITHIKNHFTGDFQEKQARAALARAATEDQPLAELQRQHEAARTELERAIADRTQPGGTKDAKEQRQAVAAARFRELKDAIKTHPDRVAGLLRDSWALSKEARAARDAGDVEKARTLEDRMMAKADDLQSLPVKLVARIRDDLQAKGDLPKDTEMEEPPREEMPEELLGKRGTPEDEPEYQERGKLATLAGEIPARIHQIFKTARDFKNKLVAKMQTLPNRDIIASTKDGAENAAGVTGRQTGNMILRELNTAFGETDTSVRNPLREHALTAAIEADGDRSKLDEFRDTILSSEHYRGVWAKRMLDAIAYAKKNWDKLQKPAALYKHFTDIEVEDENKAGINTLTRSGGYVFHLQDVLENWALPDSGGGGGPAAPFKHIREHATYADAIAGGVSPKSLSAVDLMQKRMTLGRTLINLRSWVDSLHRLTDPKTQLPVTTQPVVRMKADGTNDTTAPPGYALTDFAGQRIAIHKGYEGLFSALTDTSWFAKGSVRPVVMKAATASKHLQLLFDSYHLGRLAFWNSMVRGAGTDAIRSFLPGNPFAFKKGITLLDNSDVGIRRLAENGEIPKEWVPELQSQRNDLNKMIGMGLNVGRVADNIHADWIAKLPVTGQFGKWLFDKFQRGAMTSSALIELARQRRMQAGAAYDDGKVMRQVVKDINTRFGNLNSQSWIKSKTGQDLARVILLAPQWNESLVRAEAGAAKQLLQAPGLTLKHGRVNIGVLGRAAATAAVGTFIGNQIINYITRGQPTWENKEEGFGAKVSAWIPDVVGNGPGFFLNPFTLPAEMSHLFLHGAARGNAAVQWDHKKSAVDNLGADAGNLGTAAFQSGKEMVRGRLNMAARTAAIGITGEDSLGQKLRPNEIMPSMLSSLIPLPISGSSVARGVKQLATGEHEEKYPGQFEKQMFQSAGVKLEGTPNDTQRIRTLASQFNQAKGIQPDAEFFHGDYYDLDNATAMGNKTDMRAELQDLLQKKTPEQIEQHYEKWARSPFTGQAAREDEFYNGLTAEQKRTYDRATAARDKLKESVLNLLP